MTTRENRANIECSSPIEAAILLDYWHAALASPDEAAVEEHLLACDRCGDRLRDVITLSDSLRTLVRAGTLRVVVSDELVRRAEKTGRKVREYVVPPGGSVQCTVAADDDLLVARLAADLSGAQRVDLSFCDAHRVERQRMTDIPVRREAGSVVYQESIAFAKASSSMTMVARLVTVDANGTERLLGEYTLHHTRTIPGPGL